MPKSDSWPGVVSQEPMSGMDSAGSCDSMISINSTFSDDSLEHLSAEEKACLMFLEETIDSLDVEDDSGLSNDEPDRPSHVTAGKMAQHPSIHHNKLEPHGDPSKDHRPSPRYLVPTPLLVATGNAKLDTRPGELSPRAKPAVFVDSPDGFRSTPDHHQTALAALKRAGSSKAPTAKPSIELSREDADLPPSFIPEPPVKTRVSESKQSPPKSLDTKKHKSVSPEMLLGWIPPPSDFMDEPKKRDAPHSPLNLSVVDGPPEWTPELPKIQRHSYGGSAKPEVIKPQSIEKSRASLSKNDIENLRQKASMKKAPLTPVMIAQHSAGDYPRTPSPSSEHPPSDPKTPPPVAPKQKLPSNIILKSHKETGAANPLLSPSDHRTQMDKQKVHMEALRKLGLLKNDEVDSRPVSSAQSPTFKSKDLSPVSPHSPPVYPTFPTVEPLQDRSRSPAPADIHLRTDSTKHRDVLETVLKTPPARPYEIKSASLGRTGVGLNSLVVEPRTLASNSDTSNVELSPGQLRKSRDRPSSSGSVKDVNIGHFANESPKLLHGASSLPTQAAGDAQKVPRFNGISVVITPNGKNGENRREALKKLGLLKDGSSR